MNLGIVCGSFHREEVEQLNNGWELPIVLSFVCNTGDFGNDYSGVGLDKCFVETRYDETRREVYDYSTFTFQFEGKTYTTKFIK